MPNELDINYSNLRQAVPSPYLNAKKDESGNYQYGLAPKTIYGTNQVINEPVFEPGEKEKLKKAWAEAKNQPEPAEPTKSEETKPTGDDEANKRLAELKSLLNSSDRFDKLEDSETTKDLQKMLNEYKSIKTQFNLRPLLALADTWNGTNMAATYSAPKTEAENKIDILKLQALIDSKKSSELTSKASAKRADRSYKLQLYNTLYQPKVKVSDPSIAEGRINKMAYNASLDPSNSKYAEKISKDQGGRATSAIFESALKQSLETGIPVGDILKQAAGE